jgi:hypothetical protein
LVWRATERIPFPAENAVLGAGFGFVKISPRNT